MYILKMDGEKVRMFDNSTVAKVWAKKHCKGSKIEICALKTTKMPKASKLKFRPNEDMPELRHKPFVSLS